MLINKLRDYYGFPDKEQVEYITRATKDMTEELQDDIAIKIIESRPKKYGFPDIAAMAKFLNNNKSSKGMNFFWAVCNDCGCEYDYRFYHCPKCLGKAKWSGYKVRVSETGIPAKVIRYNLTTLVDNGPYTSCVKCVHKDNGFCSKFGDPEKQCSAQDFEYCECKKCCVYHKKANENNMRMFREKQ